MEITRYGSNFTSGLLDAVFWTALDCNVPDPPPSQSGDLNLNMIATGGYVNLGEEFSDAAVREVLEETGVRSTFSSVLTVRHSHNIQFGRSDVYIICKLSLDLTEKEMEIVVDQEIENAKWMSLTEFKAVNKHPMLACVANILLADNPGLVESEMPSPVKNRGPFKLYHPKL